MQCAIRLAANPSSPAHEVSFPQKYVGLNDNKPKSIKSFGIRNPLLLESAIIKPQNIEKHFTPNIPVWCLKQPVYLLTCTMAKSLKQIQKNTNSLKGLSTKLYRWLKRRIKCLCFYISQPLQYTVQRIPDGSSIFTAEAKTGDLALDFIRTRDTNYKFIMSYDVESGSEITPCNRINKPLVDSRFSGNVMTSITTLPTHNDNILTFFTAEMRFTVCHFLLECDEFSQKRYKY